MSKRIKSEIKNLFKNGDAPTQQDFEDLIDSTHNNMGVEDFGSVSGIVNVAPNDYNTLTYNISGNCSFELSEGNMINGMSYTILLIFDGSGIVTFSSDFYDLETLVGESGNHILISGQYINSKFYAVKSKVFDVIDLTTPSITLNSISNVGSNDSVGITLTDSVGTAQSMRVQDVLAGAGVPSWDGVTLITYDNDFVYTASTDGNRDVYIRVYNSEGDYDTVSGNVFIELTQIDHDPPSLTINSITDTQDGGNVTIDMTDSEGTASTMKIISQISGGTAPSEGDWSGATAISYESSHIYDVGSTGIYEIYVRVYNLDNEYDTALSVANVTLLSGPEIYKMTFGDVPQGFETVVSEWDSISLDVEGSSMYATNTIGVTDQVLITLSAASISVQRESNMNDVSVTSTNAKFPDEVLIKGSNAYGRFITDNNSGIYEFTGLSTGHTYSFEILGSVDLTATGWSESDTNSTTYELVGATTVSQEINPVGNTGASIAELTVQPDITGKIVLNFSGDEDWDHATINALIMTKSE